MLEALNAERRVLYLISKSPIPANFVHDHVGIPECRVPGHTVFEN
jgi:hypothetical protein